MGKAAMVAGALLVLAAPVSGQGVGARIGVGPVYTDEVGAAGLLAVQYSRDALVFRGEARGVTAGRSGDWEGSARVIAVGGAAGARIGPAASSLRPYILVTVATGLDPREADRMNSFGAAIGIERARAVGYFVEARAERWVQHGVRHHELPRNVLSLTGGLSIR